MTYKDILVYVDNADPCAARLDVAVALAAQQGAHLTGLYVRPVAPLPDYIASEFGGRANAMQERFIEEQAVAAKALFDQAVKDADIACEWRDVVGDRMDLLPLHGRYADLVIAGQGEEELPAGEFTLAEYAIMELGRPVLVIPYAGRFPIVGRKVMVAWNASREATRAVNDALPLLITARRVSILAINPQGGDDGHGDVPGADICLHLARHGVNAVCESLLSDDVDTGAMLLSRAADDSIDLLVMGAYGRSRLRELVLGGATRHIMEHMTLPVLFSR